MNGPIVSTRAGRRSPGRLSSRQTGIQSATDGLDREWKEPFVAVFVKDHRSWRTRRTELQQRDAEEDINLLKIVAIML